jgi:hypothetical protein
MTITREADVIFTDALDMQTQAVRQIEGGDFRDAAEKAWCATKRATDAMVLSITGREPRTAGQTIRILRTLRFRLDGPVFGELEGRYNTRANVLHGQCFYDGNCEPGEVLEQDIRDTLRYINDARAIAESYPEPISIVGWRVH